MYGYFHHIYLFDLNQVINFIRLCESMTRGHCLIHPRIGALLLPCVLLWPGNDRFIHIPQGYFIGTGESYDCTGATETTHWSHEFTKTCNIWKASCVVSLLIRSILGGKKSNELTDQQDMVCFICFAHLLSIRAITSWQMLMNNEFKADTSTGNPTGNSRWRHVL